MKKRMILSYILIVALMFGAGMGTFAWFTSSVKSTNNVFATGSLTLGLSGQTTESKPFSFGGYVAPGDIVTVDNSGESGMSEIIIENTGSLDMGLFFGFELDETEGDYNLADMLYFTNFKMEFLTKDGIWLPEDHFIENGDLKGNKTFIDLAGTDGKISLAEWVSVANTYMGPKNGWHVAALKPNNKYRILFELKFNEDAGNYYQGLETTGKFKAVATQLNAEAIGKIMTEHNISYHATPSDLLTEMNRFLGFQDTEYVPEPSEEELRIQAIIAAISNLVSAEEINADNYESVMVSYNEVKTLIESFTTDFPEADISYISNYDMYLAGLEKIEQIVEEIANEGYTVGEGEPVKLEKVKFTREGNFIYLTATAYYKDAQGSYKAADYYDVTAISTTDFLHHVLTDANGNFTIKIGGLYPGEQSITLTVGGLHSYTLTFFVE